MIKNDNQEKMGGHTERKSLRLWPGVLIVALQWLFRYLIPTIIPEAMMFGVLFELLSVVAILAWWIFFSRATRTDRWSVLALMVAALFVTSFFLDVSIATANMGLMFMMYSIPVMCLALVLWAAATRRLSGLARRMSMIVTILLASGMWIFLRTNGMDGDGHHDFDWRWAKTHEDRLLEQPVREFSSLPSAKVAVTPEAEWPGFRGPNRDGIIRGVKLKTDWSASPPVEMWRRQVGPGCSSFAVQGELLYTQEQRGEYETVSCYNLNTGDPVWKHQDNVRFYDSHAGAGPRSTPTLADGRVYTLGGTGILNVLDASNGSLIWSHDAASDAGVKVLTWGFSGSPLVVNNLVIVALAGKLAAYNTVSGKSRWFGTDGGSGYSSPQLFTINGISQVLLMSQVGAVSVEPESGKKLWEYSWPIDDRILQPAMLENGDLLLCRETKEVRRVSVSKESEGFKITERWASPVLNFFFNDLVIDKDHAYGFDGPSIACIDLKDGKRVWKGDRYRGWLLLLEDQDLLLVLTEKGELALVPADPAKFTELARFPAIKGKTWNHPALVGDILVVRNAQEMAAFRLPLADKES